MTRRKMESHNLRTLILASTLQENQKNKRQRKEDIRLTKMMLTIFILFLICFLPLMLVNVLDDDMTKPSIHIIGDILIKSLCLIRFLSQLLFWPGCPQL